MCEEAHIEIRWIFAQLLGHRKMKDFAYLSGTGTDAGAGTAVEDCSSFCFLLMKLFPPHLGQRCSTGEVEGSVVEKSHARFAQ